MSDIKNNDGNRMRTENGVLEWACLPTRGAGETPRQNDTIPAEYAILAGRESFDVYEGVESEKTHMVDFVICVNIMLGNWLGRYIPTTGQGPTKSWNQVCLAALMGDREKLLALNKIISEGCMRQKPTCDPFYRCVMFS